MLRDAVLRRVPARLLALQKGEPLHSIKVIYARAAMDNPVRMRTEIRVKAAAPYPV